MTGNTWNTAGDLEVGGVVASLAGHERVLAGARRCEVVDRLGPTHHPGLRLDSVDLEAAALEAPLVGLRVQAEAQVEPVVVPVERVGVLHDELPDAEESPSRPWLVPVLRREVVEHLRQVAIALDLLHVEREGLLVRHRQDELTAASILQPEHLGNVVAAGRLPELGRGQDRAQHLLGTDRVHLLADDLDDALVHPPAERQEGEEPRGDRSDEATSQQQAVAHGLRLGRILP